MFSTKKQLEIQLCGNSAVKFRVAMFTRPKRRVTTLIVSSELVSNDTRAVRALLLCTLQLVGNDM